ncbi:MAG: hypothetical protein M1816_000873 [Peltula sp. TS41687]|nr:MAG: hypothetical protein M1816_000873 [Peltula sp. TS41687]
MPLHLLGKKSWNVYSQDNIDRVRRDEAAAKAREEEEERRMQEADAEKRIEILRGNTSVSTRPLEPPPKQEARPARRERERKRKRVGEDDTDRDIRLARENATFDSGTALEKPKTSQYNSSKDVSLTDRSGHINLFPEERAAKSQIAKNPEAEAEAARKKREYEDQYTMRFSNAAGFRQGLNDPWYSSLEGTSNAKQEDVGTDVWGNEDHGRKERDRRKRESDDPLASMRRAVQGLKAVERERKVWMGNKEREMRDLKRMQKESHRRSSKRHRHHRDEDGLEGFSLDDPPPPKSKAQSRDNDDGDTTSHGRSHRHRRDARDDKLHGSSRDEYYRRKDRVE